MRLIFWCVRSHGDVLGVTEVRDAIHLLTARAATPTGSEGSHS